MEVLFAAGSKLSRTRHITPHAVPSLPLFVIPPVPITRRRIFGLLAGAAAAVGVPSIWISLSLIHI